MKSRAGLLAAATMVLFAAGACDVIRKEIGKTNPPVNVLIQDYDGTGLGTEIMSDMVQALRKIKGVTIAESDPAFQFTIILYPICDGKQFAASAVIEEPFAVGPPGLHRHVLCIGTRKKVRGCCEKLVQIFNSDVLTPLREDLGL
jgi:hypothetical protein